MCLKVVDVRRSDLVIHVSLSQWQSELGLFQKVNSPSQSQFEMNPIEISRKIALHDHLFHLYCYQSSLDRSLDFCHSLSNYDL